MLSHGDACLCMFQEVHGALIHGIVVLLPQKHAVITLIIVRLDEEISGSRAFVSRGITSVQESFGR